MEFSLLINMKMPTIFGIFIFIGVEIFMFSKKKMQLLVICDLLAGQIPCSAELSMKKVLLPRGQISLRIAKLLRSDNEDSEIRLGDCAG